MSQLQISTAKRGNLTGGALTAEVLDSSPTVLRHNRGDTTTGLQQYYSPPEVAQLIAAVHGTTSSTLDLTAGDGALLAPVDRTCRFGVEIDADQVAAGQYTALTGDIQRLYPMMRLLRMQFPRLACNPPFGLDWTSSAGGRENSTVATWRMAQALIAPQGLGAFIAGRDRFFADVLTRPDATNVYALIECPDLFEGVQLPTVIVFFAHPAFVRAPRPDGPLRLFSRCSELGPLADTIIAERDRVCGWLPPARFCRHAEQLSRTFTAIARELERRRQVPEADRQTHDLALVGGRISFRPSPFARLALNERRALRNVTRLDRQPVNYFALNLREWQQVQALAHDDVLTIDPDLRDAVVAATRTAERDVCPLYSVVPQMRLAFLEDLDSIRCTSSDPARGFEAGERYPLSTRSDVKRSVAERPFHKRDGDIEIRRYEQEAKVLQIGIGDEVFDESAEDVQYLLEHFELPDPGDLGSRFPDQVQAARETLTALADEYDFTFFRKDDEAWQLEDLARLVVKGSGVLAWEQGGGKSLGGATLIHAAWRRGAAKRALIVCPQDLIPQWTREIAKFYGTAPIHITSPAQARRVARDLRAGGEGLYITHYEVLSLVGRVDEPLPVTRLRLPVHERGEHEIAPTSIEFCPACHGSHFDGWQQDSAHVCGRCGYVHKRLKVQTAGHYLAHAFADGVIVVDEGTLAKGNDSLRSKAIRGLRARHRYLLTGTPVSNYVNDVFWLLWWTLGNATLRFPYAYEGGRAKFEADFCVIEYLHRDGRRQSRKVLPQVTNVSRLWRLLAGGMIRRRKQDMGKLVPRTTRTIAAPMGSAQLELYRFWLNTRNFERYFAYKHPGHRLINAGLVEKFAAALGQLTKLEYATTLPEADPDRDWVGTAGLRHSNWTPKNFRVLQVAMEHVEAGEKVLIGSDLIETGRWLAARLQEKGVNAAHIVEERAGKTATMSPRRRAKAIEAFKTGDTQVLCCGIPSIRLGHSLETASCVIATGLVFSYEMFDQFIARAWRLTSKRPVSVYVALTLGSIDGKKWELLCQKAQAADLALDGQLVDEPEQPISREEFLRDLRKQGVRPTGDEIAEADICAAWQAIPQLTSGATARTVTPVLQASQPQARQTQPNPPSPASVEQLTLFV